MEYRTIPGDSRRLSVLAMGTHMNLGCALNDAEAQALVDAALEGGVTVFDTADAYADGAAERVLGKCLTGAARESLTIITKVGAVVDGEGGLSASHIRRQIDASLGRLGMDYVDAYLCHCEDRDTPLRDTVATMSRLIDGGKIHHWGVSNWSAERIVAANTIAREEGFHAIRVCQPRYSLLYREPEHTLFPMLIRESIAATTFSPLAHGVLAGVYTLGQEPPAGTRASMAGENRVTLELYYNDENLRRAEALKGLAAALGTTAAALATAWCATHEAVATVIMGAWNAREMRENLRAAEMVLDAHTRGRLDEIFPAMAL